MLCENCIDSLGNVLPTIRTRLLCIFRIIANICVLSTTSPFKAVECADLEWQFIMLGKRTTNLKFQWLSKLCKKRWSRFRVFLGHHHKLCVNNRSLPFEVRFVFHMHCAFETPCLWKRILAPTKTNRIRKASRLHRLLGKTVHLAWSVINPT